MPTADTTLPPSQHFHLHRMEKTANKYFKEKRKMRNERVSVERQLGEARANHVPRETQYELADVARECLHQPYLLPLPTLMMSPAQPTPPLPSLIVRPAQPTLTITPTTNDTRIVLLRDKKMHKK